MFPQEIVEKILRNVNDADTMEACRLVSPIFAAATKHVEKKTQFWFHIVKRQIPTSAIFDIYQKFFFPYPVLENIDYKKIYYCWKYHSRFCGRNSSLKTEKVKLHVDDIGLHDMKIVGTFILIISGHSIDLKMYIFELHNLNNHISVKLSHSIRYIRCYNKHVVPKCGITIKGSSCNIVLIKEKDIKQLELEYNTDEFVQFTVDRSRQVVKMINYNQPCNFYFDSSSFKICRKRCLNSRCPYIYNNGRLPCVNCRHPYTYSYERQPCLSSRCPYTYIYGRDPLYLKQFIPSYPIRCAYSSLLFDGAKTGTISAFHTHFDSAPPVLVWTSNPISSPTSTIVAMDVAEDKDRFTLVACTKRSIYVYRFVKNFLL